MLQTNPVYVTFVLLLLVVLSEWLGQRKYFSYLGSSLIVIIAAAILANAGILPSSQNAPPLYEGIFTYIAPLAIFYLLLDVKLTSLKQAGLPMLTLFLIGAVSTVAGVIAGYLLLIAHHTDISQAYAVAGMFTGTYIGGSANLNAVALQYSVFKNGALFAAINAADNIITALWMMATLVLPVLLQRLSPMKAYADGYTKSNAFILHTDTAKENITLVGFSLLLALGMGTLFLSQVISSYIPQVPAILILTTIALILAQIKPLHRVKGGSLIGYLFVLLFLAVVGAYCDIGALIQNKATAIVLLEWISIIVLIHGSIIFIIGRIFRQDWCVVAVASNANIGGATSTAALATAINRADLRLPGILVGSLGNALGTYMGIVVAEMLK